MIDDILFPMERKSFRKFAAVLFLFGFACFGCFGDVVFLNSRVPQRRHYVLYVKGYDWGPVTTKVVCNPGKKFSEMDLKPEDFEITRVIMPSGITNSSFGLSKGERKVVRAFPSDGYGKKVDGESQYFTLEFEINPVSENQDPFVRNILLTGNMNEFYGFKIENENLDLKITRLDGLVCPEAARFNFSMMNDEEVKVQFAFYENTKRNKTKNEKSALILWMHGIAEGGSNPYIPLLGNKAVNLSEETVQQYFEGGADLIIPQCPTGWLETTTKDSFGLRMWAPVDLEGSVNNVVKPVGKKLGVDLSVAVNEERDEDWVPPATVSYYSGVIRKIIDDYLVYHPYIDEKRIYIGGCSAGGYMALNMLIQNPDLFAAAFTACEAYPDSKITEKQIRLLSKIPLWMTHSENDKTIKPKNHDEDTVRRLRAEGAKNLHFTMYKDVRDLTGSWFNADGTPYEYDTHASWIYVLNNSPEENGVTLFEWLSKQVLANPR